MTDTSLGRVLPARRDTDPDERYIQFPVEHFNGEGASTEVQVHPPPLIAVRNELLDEVNRLAGRTMDRRRSALKNITQHLASALTEDFGEPNNALRDTLLRQLLRVTGRLDPKGITEAQRSQLRDDFRMLAQAEAMRPEQIDASEAAWAALGVDALPSMERSVAVWHKQVSSSD